METMIKTISASEAVRTFSYLLNAVKYKGDSFTILRGGKATAMIVPAEKPVSTRTLKELSSYLKNMPVIE